MADITYPDTLPDFRIGKSREQLQTYRNADPFSGPAYTQKVTDDQPCVWNVTIKCTNQIQARQFQAFLRAIPDGTPFNKDIWTEEGYVTHEVKFLEMPLRPSQQNNYVWTYSGVIYATKLIQNDAVVDDGLIYEWLQDAEILDIALNKLWAES